MMLCFDGVDGAGKTTQVTLLQIRFLNKGYNVVVLKPFHFIGLSLKKLRFSGKTRRLINLLKQAQICSYKIGSSTNIKSPLVKIYVTNLALLLLVMINLKFETIVSRVIYGADVIIIYDRFYFDKLIPSNKFWYTLFYAILKRVIEKRCVIFDTSTLIAYKRMKDLYDKLLPKDHYNTLRKWYRIYAKLLGFPVINTSHSSLLETHAQVVSIFENLISRKGAVHD
ncbi:MAG: hypothetical protein QXY55_06530 [Candidatus Korarchaeota archaeon]